MNYVCLFGRISTDLELKSTTNGKSICNFNLAVNKYGNENANFIPCRVWDRVAENLTRYKKKGDQIIVVGSLEISEYQDNNGENKRHTYVNVNQIHFVSTGSNQNAEMKKVEEEVFGYSTDDDEIEIRPEDLPF